MGIGSFFFKTCHEENFPNFCRRLKVMKFVLAVSVYFATKIAAAKGLVETK